MNFNFHWPMTKSNNKAPWYSIVRRVVFFIPVFTALYLFLLFVFLGWGWPTMKAMYKDIV